MFAGLHFISARGGIGSGEASAGDKRSRGKRAILGTFGNAARAPALSVTLPNLNPKLPPPARPLAPLKILE